MRAILISTFFLTGFILVSSTKAQFYVPEGGMEALQSFFYLDYSYFAVDQESEEIRLEIYYQVFNRGLTFRKKAKEYIAEYDLICEIYDNDDNRKGSANRKRKIIVEQEKKAQSVYDFRTGQFNFIVKPGKYKVKFQLYDRGNGKSIDRSEKLKLKRLLRDTPLLSGIEFTHAFSPIGKKSGIFDKGEVMIVPSVSRVFGGEEGARLIYYFEIMSSIKDSEKVVIETRLRHDTKGMVYRDTLHVTLDNFRTRQLREISLEKFIPGDYEMEITLRGWRNKKLFQRREEFKVSWSQEAMIRNDWKTTIAQLRLIADQGDLKEMKNVESLSDRIRSFTEFWLSKDPTPGTPANEVRAEFYRRLMIANNSFTVMRRPGWRSDRGRIFIIHGMPDQLDDEPFPIDSQPYQVWQYFATGRYRKFVFVDENQDGDYRLQYPYDGLYQRPDF